MSDERILLMEWETMIYWYHRAQEIFYKTIIEEVEDGKVDDDTFEVQKKRLYAKINRLEKENEGTING